MSSSNSRRLVPALCIALLLAACGSNEPAATTAATSPPAEDASPLVGQWERSESTFTSLDGMDIEVQRDGSEAIIVSVPENEYQFQVGDIKWRAITSAGPDEYTFEDLVREEGSGATSYVEGVITVVDGDTLEMTFPTTGTVQEWVRTGG